MCMSRMLAFAALALIASVATVLHAEQPRWDVGMPVDPHELDRFFAVQPDGAGLPPGSGTAAAGEIVYAERCAMCHGEKLEGIEGTGAPPLAGGRGTLATAKPLKTVESYWPYASTLYDYIWRAMPFDQPGSLTPDEVYALSAYILAQGKLIDETQVLDAKSLPKVKMLNEKGFYRDGGPDRLIYRSEGQAGAK